MFGVAGVFTLSINHLLIKFLLELALDQIDTHRRHRNMCDIKTHKCHESPVQDCMEYRDAPLSLLLTKSLLEPVIKILALPLLNSPQQNKGCAKISYVGLHKT